jgi:hypothetical protein
MNEEQQMLYDFLNAAHRIASLETLRATLI